jgi:signal peptidase I
MTPPAAPSARLSPWLSAWFKPRATIDFVLATNPTRHVLLLAAVATAADIVARLMIGESWGLWVDWRVDLVVVLACAALGILGLYVSSALMRWTALPLGGRASARAVRAALAWGRAPMAIGMPICIAIGFGLYFSGVVSQTPLVAVFAVVTLVLSLWSVVCGLLMYARVQGFGFWRTIANFAIIAVLVLSIALAVRVFLFQPFSISSGSMQPTLLYGDYVFVAKYAYGYSRYSLPFSPPLFSGRVFAAAPQRGDLAVFRLPKGPSIDYVKRIVGLPGDRIQMIDGVLQLNGTPVKHERIEDFVAADGKHVRRYRETLPNGVSYATLDVSDNGFYDNTALYTVPAGHYFVLGDNLDNSTDSRVLSQVGYVPFENLIGRVAIVFFSTSPESRGTPAAVRFERIGATAH